MNKQSIVPYVQISRPWQWIKNVFIFAPAIFANELSEPSTIIRAIGVFCVFCLVSSLVYIVNDIVDADSDRLHPIKSKSRPIAMGTLKMRQAIYLTFFLISIIFFYFLKINFDGELIIISVIYIILNFLYSFYLKRQPILDIFCIAICFELRIYAGGTLIDPPISSWMLITTFSLALYLAAVKRRQELLVVGAKSRSVLEKYTLAIMDRYCSIAGTCAIVFYSLFTLTAKPEMTVLIPLVIYGIFRYWYIIETHRVGEAPSAEIIKDPHLIITILIWLFLTVIFL